MLLQQGNVCNFRRWVSCVPRCRRARVDGVVVGLKSTLFVHRLLRARLLVLLPPASSPKLSLHSRGSAVAQDVEGEDEICSHIKPWVNTLRLLTHNLVS